MDTPPISSVADGEQLPTVITEQPTGSMPPTPAMPHPELSVAQMPAGDDEALERPLMDATGAMPVWALETLPLFAPRPMPKVKNETSKETPLEVMLRDL